MTLLGFFLSSRRRHTRCSRDWSSDVCSSDLYHAGGQTIVGDEDDGLAAGVVLGEEAEHLGGRGRVEVARGLVGQQHRSEERRVGKECRYGGAACVGGKNRVVFRQAWSPGPQA